MRRALLRAVLLTAVVGALVGLGGLLSIHASDAASAETPVDLELVLAVDISFSMDLEEQKLQREGYVRAFRDPALWAAVKTGALGRIAVTYVEWAGENIQDTLVGWTLIDGPVAAGAFANALEVKPISRNRFTSISGALLYSSRQFGKGGFAGARRVIDVSGDGPNNSGIPVAVARDAVVKNGIVINGLPIILKASLPGGFFDMADLDRYYTACVIGGPGAFVIAVRKKEELIAAIRRKLILEIAGLFGGGGLIPVEDRPATQGDAMDCLIGERQWQRYNNRLNVP